jgi:hypothetical protein
VKSQRKAGQKNKKRGKKQSNTGSGVPGAELGPGGLRKETRLDSSSRGGALHAGVGEKKGEEGAARCMVAYLPWKRFRQRSTLGRLRILGTQLKSTTWPGRAPVTKTTLGPKGINEYRCAEEHSLRTRLQRGFFFFFLNWDLNNHNNNGIIDYRHGHRGT